MDSLGKLKAKLTRGRVYRRAELQHFSNAVDRHLGELVAEGTLQKLSQGLYFYPRNSVFGQVPPNESELVRAFLKDDVFLITSPNDYNVLGVGTTQLYNRRVVYNHKRHGEFDLGGRKFFFHLKPKFPKKLSEEFLLVDLVNNLDLLAEDKEAMLAVVSEKVAKGDKAKLTRAVFEYAGARAKKFFYP
jgi:hypothetical protein